MSVSHEMRSFRALLAAAVTIGLFLPGCGGQSADNAPAATDSKLGQRRQEMSDFMKAPAVSDKAGTSGKP